MTGRCAEDYSTPIRHARLSVLIARAHALFAEALDHDPSQRIDWLRLQCGEDAELLAQVLHLLRADAAASVLDREVDGLAQGLVGCPAATEHSVGATGARIGPYRIVAPLGRGGMGSVWRAERSDGTYTGQVAIKLLAAPLADAESLRRFAQERQILARLVHPNMARMLDAGTVDGVPWFAMDLVEGVPLDSWVRQQAPSQEAVLRLLAKVAATVQFAHQNLVVHRDLKPSNILVDADGEPHLLDFGIAKLLDGESEQTRSHAPLSLPYAAPEQLLGEAVTTATDVYSLGVLLYEALCGVRPFNANGNGVAVWLQTLSDRDPVPPSRQVGEPVRRRQLQGDPDLIVLKCLARDPARRYGSAQALQDDLLAVVARQPVRARAASWRYRAARFLRRHPLGVTLGSVALLSVLVLSLVSFQQARQAQIERAQALAEAERATAVQNFLIQLFEQQRPDESLGVELSARDLLDRAEVQLRSGDGLSPASREALLTTLGTLRYDLGDTAEALRLNEQAVALARELHGADSYPLGRALVDRAYSHMQLGRNAEGVADCERAGAALFAAHPSSPEQVIALLECAAVMREAGELQATAPWLERTAALAEALDPASSSIVLKVVRQRFRLAQARTDHPQALILGTRLIDGLRADPETSGSDLATALHSRASSERRLGKLSAAVADYREALALHLSVFGRAHDLPIMTTMHLALALDDQGQAEASEQLRAQALADARAHLSDDHATLPALLSFAVRMAVRRNALKEAAALLEEAITLTGRQSAPALTWVLTLDVQRAELLRLRGDASAARALAEQVLERLPADAARGWLARQTHLLLAALAADAAQPVEQEAQARWCLEALTTEPAEATEVPEALAQLALAQLTQGQQADAQTSAVTLEATARAQLEAGSTARAQALAVVALVALQSDDTARALRMLEELRPDLPDSSAALQRPIEALLAQLRFIALQRLGRDVEAAALAPLLAARRAEASAGERWFWQLR